MTVFLIIAGWFAAQFALAVGVGKFIKHGTREEAIK